MNIRPRLSRALVPLLVAVGAIIGLVMVVGSAGAAPATSPTIDSLSPADGAPVAATGEAFTVTFTCPEFLYEEGEVLEEESEEPGERKEKEENEEELLPPIVSEVPPVIGKGENYGVHFSPEAHVNALGQLSTGGFGEGGEGEAEPVKGSAALCTSEFEAPKASFPPTLAEGRVFWQPYRESTVVPGEVEVGAVQSFVIYPHVEEPELTFREQVFVGYLTKVGLSYEAELPGATVQLQMWEGSGWTTLAEAPGSKRGENTFFVKIKIPGRHVFRPLVLGGPQPLGLESATKVVRKLPKTRVTSAADDGTYVAADKKEQEESPIGFKVKSNGTVLSNLKLEAETTCAGPTKGQDVKIEVAAVLPYAKIAPDGTVFGVSTPKGTEAWTVTLSGSIFEGRFQGELSTSHANCSGYRRIDAVLKK